MRPHLVMVLVALPAIAPAQFSGYVSAGYGVNSNPLYNYEMTSDRLGQTYLELTHTLAFPGSAISFSYVNGAVLFDRLAERTYLEHRLTVRYGLRLAPARRPAKEEEEEGTGQDSTGSYLDVTLRGSARHDRDAFREFDNVAGEAGLGYRFAAGAHLFAALAGDVAFRSYTNRRELSNIVGFLHLRTGGAMKGGGGLSGGLVLGIKGFPNPIPAELVDTTAAVTPGGGSPGNGRGGGTAQQSSAATGAAPASSVGYQVMPFVSYAMPWTRGSIAADLRYRFHGGAEERFLVGYVNEPTLNQDIYYEEFGYEGLEAALRYTQRLPAGLQSILTATAVDRRYGIPAFTLAGEALVDTRTDLNASLELWLSRYIALAGSVGVEIAVDALLMRNLSNDAYNDYSLFSFSLFVGIGL